jgi:hypothetical protein
MTKSKIYDYIVVGSGCTGVHAAQTLIENEKEVLMLDVGNEDDSNIKFPNKSFFEIRENETNQSNLFLGKNYEGIPWGPIKPGHHLTPGRKYITKDTDKYLKYNSKDYELFESLAKGGLGCAWGAGSYTFDKDELEKCNLDPKEMDEAYATIFSRIGITKGNNQNNYKEEQPLKADKSMQIVMDRYKQTKEKFKNNNLVLRRTPLAVITSDKEDRKKYQYRDMDFWHDNDKSVYRPWITLSKLLKSSLFNYKSSSLVMVYKELENKIEVEVLNTKSQKTEIFYCKKIMLGASVFGTTRIVLRSYKMFNHKINYLCNTYFYIPCVNFKMLGKVNSKNKISLSQLTLYIKNKHNIEVANFFTYRSLLLFKLIKESPLSLKISRLLFKFLEPSLVIVGYHIPKSKSKKEYLVLEKNNETVLKDQLKLFSEEDKKEEIHEKSLVSKLKINLRKLGCYPLKIIKTPKGSSIHYAGTFPYSKTNKPFTTSLKGELSATKNVYIIDASSFAFLPAKGITLTAMANAHRVASHAIKND